MAFHPNKLAFSVELAKEVDGLPMIRIGNNIVNLEEAAQVLEALQHYVSIMTKMTMDATMKRNGMTPLPKSRHYVHRPNKIK